MKNEKELKDRVQENGTEVKKAQPKKLSMKDFDVIVENTHAIKGGAKIVRGGAVSVREDQDVGH